MRRPWRTISAVIACCLAAGCAGSAPKPSGNLTDCDTPGVTADEVKIGYIYPDTGLSAGLFRASRSGVEARLGEANAAGGIHGRKIVFQWEDDESDAAANLRAARDLVEQRNVFGIIETTSYAAGSAQYLNQRDVPVAGNTLESVWTRYPNMFSYAYRITTGGSVSTWGAFAKTHGGSRAVVLEAKISEASRNYGDNLAASLQAAGIDVVASLDYVPAVTNPEQLGHQIQALGADVLTGALPAEDFTKVQIAAAAAGAPLKVIMSPTGYDRNILDTYGPKVAGTYYFINYLPFEEDTPAHARYRQSVTRYSPELQPTDQELALTGYVNTDLFLRGLEAAGPCPTRAAFIANLRAVHDYRGDGLLPAPVDLAKIGQLNLCYTFVRANATGSAFDVVKDAAPLCGERLPDAGPTGGGAPR